MMVQLGGLYSGTLEFSGSPTRRLLFSVAVPMVCKFAPNSLYSGSFGGPLCLVAHFVWWLVMFCGLSFFVARMVVCLVWWLVLFGGYWWLVWWLLVALWSVNLPQMAQWLSVAIGRSMVRKFAPNGP